MFHNRKISVLFLSLGFIVLILDTKHAVLYAQEGISVCLRTVIPALFPLFVISGFLSPYLMDWKIPGSRLVGRLTGIPSGAESVFLLGLLGGYPLGAKLICENCEAGNLDIKNARRMMGFCSQAGPAFIFGIIGPLFSSLRCTLLLWANQILSAVLVGMLLPKTRASTCQKTISSAKSNSAVISDTVKAMGSICGWIILFRVLLGFLNRWILWILPETAQVFTEGILELSNGCLALTEIESPKMRYMLANVMLSLGGLCIAMQTHSVAQTMGLGLYIPGKLLQTVCSFMLACLSASFAVKETVLLQRWLLLLVASILLLAFAALILKKMVAFKRKLRYNKISFD